MEKIAALVVLYNPDEDTFLKNIPSYAPYADILILVDNSDKKKLSYEDFSFGNKNIIYIDNKENLGIATALNQGAEKAIEHGYTWLLTMDQDSWFEPRDIEALIEGIKLIDENITAILSPVHVTKGSIRRTGNNTPVEKKTVMTSGNLLNLNLFKIIGNFRDDYFIDYVDHEYCFRARASNYRIIELSDIFLNHSLGNLQIVNVPIIGKHTITNHSAIRKYYLVRNLLYFRKQYEPIFKKQVRKMFKREVKVIIKIILFEKGKSDKIKMIIRGVQDYKKGITGKFSNV